MSRAERRVLEVFAAADRGELSGPGARLLQVRAPGPFGGCLVAKWIEARPEDMGWVRITDMGRRALARGPR